MAEPQNVKPHAAANGQHLSTGMNPVTLHGGNHQFINLMPLTGLLLLGERCPLLRTEGIEPTAVRLMGLAVEAREAVIEGVWLPGEYWGSCPQSAIAGHAGF